MTSITERITLPFPVYRQGTGGTLSFDELHPRVQAHYRKLLQVTRTLNVGNRVAWKKQYGSHLGADLIGRVERFDVDHHHGSVEQHTAACYTPEHLTYEIVWLTVSGLVAFRSWERAEMLTLLDTCCGRTENKAEDGLDCERICIGTPGHAGPCEFGDWYLTGRTAKPSRALPAGFEWIWSTAHSAWCATRRTA